MLTADFEHRIFELTQPVQGKNGKQFPRPWMTRMTDPQNARVFIVGHNQRNGYPLSIGHSIHMDGLFNRNGQTCRGVYNRVLAASGKTESPTRRRIEELFTRKLEARGVHDILETNVVCVSSPMSVDLDKEERRKGREIFAYLLRTIRPKVLIVYGAGARKELSDALGCIALPELPTTEASPPSNKIIGAMSVFCVPGLVMAGWSQWRHWADAHTNRLAEAVSDWLAAMGRGV